MRYAIRFIAALFTLTITHSVFAGATITPRDVDLRPFEADRWNALNLKYFINTDLSVIPDDEQISAIDNAFAIWDYAHGFGISRTDVRSEADIVISWPETVLDEVAGKPVQQGGTVGVARANGTRLVIKNGVATTYKVKASIFLDRLDIQDPEMLTYVAAHEIGHALGFSHSSDVNDLMFPSLLNNHSTLNYRGAFLSPTDFWLLRATYGYKFKYLRTMPDVNFEGFYHWHNEGDVNWMLESGKTPLGEAGYNTGPASAAEGNTYAFIETASSRSMAGGQAVDTAFKSGTEAIIKSPIMTFRDRARMTFNYHMFGQDIGTLKLIGRTDERDRVLWTKTGQQNSQSNWQTAVVDLSYYSGDSFTLKFVATAKGGYLGNIAIDNIQFSEY